jgi:aspartate/glutamate racemase
MILHGGLNIYGIPIGVLCLESYYAKVPGHIKNATTFRFPIIYKVIKGATPERVVVKPDAALVAPLIEAARELEKLGVRAITGSCGFLAVFQRELADSVNVPVYISSLIQVPMVHHMLRRDQKVGLLVARKSTLTQGLLCAVGADSVPVCVAGMDDQKEFCDVIIHERRNELDMGKLEREVLSVVDVLVQEHPEMGALVIECTDLPPFAHLIQQKIDIPIFDIITLTNMVYQASVRTSYQGFMPR